MKLHEVRDDLQKLYDELREVEGDLGDMAFDLENVKIATWLEGAAGAVDEALGCIRLVLREEDE